MKTLAYINFAIALSLVCSVNTDSLSITGVIYLVGYFAVSALFVRYTEKPRKERGNPNKYDSQQAGSIRQS